MAILAWLLLFAGAIEYLKEVGKVVLKKNNLIGQLSSGEYEATTGCKALS